MNEQTTIWNGTGGSAWVEAQEVLDQLFKPFEHLLVEAVSQVSGERVLDVGCGTGSTTRAVARMLGTKGRCTGIDISEPMIAAARRITEREGTRASFIQADAQSYAFEAENFDTIISRFGVMFFGDSVEAFTNLRRATTADAKIGIIAWRSAEDNPFMTTAERAAAPLLPNLPVRRPDEPGQFAFADPHRVYSILEESGWADIDIQLLDVACALPERELVTYVTRLGPVGRILEEADGDIRTRVLETVRPAFDQYVHGGEVRFTAACWKVYCSKRSSSSSS
jgi:ubiquinone/menaquinone biosynthesis C-methylase UbiE